MSRKYQIPEREYTYDFGDESIFMENPLGLQRMSAEIPLRRQENGIGWDSRGNPNGDFSFPQRPKDNRADATTAWSSVGRDERRGSQPIQKGSFSSLGSIGPVGSTRSVGSMGSMGSMGSTGSTGSPYDSLVRAHSPLSESNVNKNLGPQKNYTINSSIGSSRFGQSSTNVSDRLPSRRAPLSVFGGNSTGNYVRDFNRTSYFDSGVGKTLHREESQESADSPTFKNKVESMRSTQNNDKNDSDPQQISPTNAHGHGNMLERKRSYSLENALSPSIAKNHGGPSNIGNTSPFVSGVLDGEDSSSEDSLESDFIIQSNGLGANQEDLHDRSLLEEGETPEVCSPVQKVVNLRATESIHVRNQILLLVSLAFTQIQSIISTFINSKMNTIRSAEGEIFNLENSSELFSFRKHESYISSLKMISDATANVDGFLLLLILLIEWIPNRIVGPLKERVREIPSLNSWMAFLGDFENQNEQERRKPSTYSFGSWISQPSQKTTVQCASFLDSGLESPSTGKKKSTSNDQSKRPPMVFQVFELASLMACADIASVSLRGLEISCLQESGFTKGFNSPKEMSASDSTSSEINPYDQNGFNELRNVFSFVFQIGFSIIRFHSKYNTSEQDILRIFGNRSKFHWIYIIRRLSIVNFSPTISSLVQKVKESAGMDERILALHTLKYMDVRIDSKSNRDCMHQLTDFLIHVFLKSTPETTNTKKKKLGDISSDTEALLTSSLEALRNLLSQIDFEKQSLPDLEAKVQNFYQQLLKYDTFPAPRVRAAASLLASTVLSRSTYDTIIENIEPFTTRLLMQYPQSIGEQPACFYESILNIFEDRQSCNINMKFISYFSVDDENMERCPEFAAFVFAESNKGLHSSFDVERKPLSPDGHQSPSVSSMTFTYEKQTRPLKRSIYLGIMKKIAGMLFEEFFSSKRSIFTMGISRDTIFNSRILLIAHIIVRMSLVIQEFVIQNLLPDLLDIDVNTRKSPETLLLGVRVLKLFACVSERMKTSDVKTITPSLLQDLRILHRSPNYDHMLREIKRKYYTTLQKVIEFCDEELDMDQSSISNSFESLPPLNLLPPEENAIALKSSQHIPQGQGNIIPPQNILSSNIFSISYSVDEKTNNNGNYGESHLRDSYSSAEDLIHRQQEKWDSLITISVQPVNLRSQKAKKASKLSKSKPSNSSDNSSRILFSLYLEALRCIPFLVPEQGIKSINPSQFIGRKLTLSDPLIASACFQSLQMILYDRSDLRPIIIEGCSTLLLEMNILRNDSFAISILENLSQLLDLWSAINRKDISNLFKDVSLSVDQIIGHLSATKWNEKKPWIEAIEVAALVSLASSNILLRASSMKVLQAVSRLIESEGADLPHIEKYWKKRTSLFNIITQSHDTIISSALHDLEIEDSLYCEKPAIRWNKTVGKLSLFSISQDSSFNVLWSFVLVEIIRSLLNSRYTGYTQILLETLRRRSSDVFMTIVGKDQGKEQAKEQGKEEDDSSFESHEAITVWTNLLLMFFSAAGDSKQARLPSIHGEIRSLLDGRGEIPLWNYILNPDHAWIRSGLLHACSKVNVSSISVVSQSLFHWLNNSSIPSQNKTSKGKDKQQQDPILPVHVIEFACAFLCHLSFELSQLKTNHKMEFQGFDNLLYLVYSHLDRHINSPSGFEHPTRIIALGEAILNICNALYYFYKYSSRCGERDRIASWNARELYSIMLFLRNASGYGKSSPISQLSEGLDALLSPSTKTKKSKPQPRSAEEIDSIRSSFLTLKEEIERTSQLAISSILSVYHLPVFLEGGECVPEELRWYESAERRGFATLPSLLRNHTPQLIDVYLNTIYSNRNASTASQYLHAIEAVLLSEFCCDADTQETQEKQDGEERAHLPAAEMARKTIEKLTLKAKLINLIAWGCFHEEEVIHMHSFNMARSLVDLFKDELSEEDDKVEQLKRYSIFKARSSHTLQRRATELSTLLSQIFIQETEHVIEEACVRFYQAAGSSRDNIVSLLVPWCRMLSLSSTETADHFIHLLYSMTASMEKTSALKHLWVTLAQQSEDASTPSNLFAIIQHLKKACIRDPSNIRVSRVILHSLFSVNPQQTLQELLKELQNTSEEEKETSHDSALEEESSNHQQQRVSLLHTRRVIISLVSDLICDVENLDDIRSQIPQLFLFITLHLDNPDVRNPDFQIILSHLFQQLTPPKDGAATNEWRSICHKLAQEKTITLIWRPEELGINSKQSHRNDAQVHTLQEQEVEVEVDASFLFRVFHSCLMSSGFESMSDAIAQFALDSARRATDPETLFRNLKVFRDMHVSINRNRVRMVIECLSLACDMSEVDYSPTAYELATNSVVIAICILVKFTLYYRSEGTLHLQDEIFWTAVLLMNHPSNWIYSKCLEVLSLFLEDSSSCEKYFNLFSVLSNSAFSECWIRTFAGLAVHLLNGLNTPMLNQKAMMVILSVARHSRPDKHTPETEATETNQEVIDQNCLTILLSFLFWVCTYYGTMHDDGIDLREACETVASFMQAVAPNSKIGNAIDYDTLKRSRESFFSNICAEISLQYLPHHSKQVIEILQCFLKEAVNASRLVRLINAIYLHEHQTSIHLYSPLVTTLITKSWNAEQTKVDQEKYSQQELRAQVLDLVTTVSQRTTDLIASDLGPEGLEDDLRHLDFSLPLADLTGLGLDLRTIIEVSQSNLTNSSNSETQDEDYGENVKLELEEDSFMDENPQSHFDEAHEEAEMLNSTPQDDVQIDFATRDQERGRYNRQRKDTQIVDTIPERLQLINAPHSTGETPVSHHPSLRSSTRYDSADGATPRTHSQKSQSKFAAFDLKNPLQDSDCEIQEDLLSPIPPSNGSVLLRSFASLEGLSMTMSPARRAPLPPPTSAPPQKIPLRPAPQPFFAPRKVEEILNNSISFSYFKSYCTRLSNKLEGLLSFYESVLDFMNQSKYSMRAILAEELIARYLNYEEVVKDSIPEFIRSKILDDFDRNPQTPSKLLFTSFMDWIINILDEHVDDYLQSEEYSSYTQATSHRWSKV